jgi:putative peptidoglycan lipid II flippase
MTPDPSAAPPPETRRSLEPPSEDSTRSFVRNTVVMSVGTTLSRLTGFLRLSAMAFAIGITETRLADAYNIANITPNILYELALGGILTSVVVPVVVEWLQTYGRDAAWDVIRRLFTLALVVLSVIALVAIVLAPWIADLYTAGYSAKPFASSSRSSCDGSCHRSSSTGSGPWRSDC